MDDHCCEKMREEAGRTCDRHPDRFDCPDCLVHYSPGAREYGLIIRDGGPSVLAIRFCPWCGAGLPGSVEAPDEQVAG